MLNFSYKPTFRDLLKIFFKSNLNLLNYIKKKWCLGNKDFIKLFTRSSWILFLLVCAKLNQKKNKLVIIWLPSYYCSESLYLIQKLNVRFYYYEIDKNFIARENSLKKLSEESIPDIIVFCNFFGKYNFTSLLKDLSLKFNAWLVEDCTHCISPDNKIGKQGDIAFFSPYKFFPLPHGAIMTTSKLFLDKNKLNFFNSDELFDNFLKKSLKTIDFRKKNNFFYLTNWLIKKILIKFDLYRPKIRDFDYDEEVKNLNYFNHPNLDYFSINILASYAKKINHEKEKRIRMFLLWKQYLKQFSLFGDENFELNSDWNIHTPYFFLISSKDSTKKMYNFLKEKNIPVLTWPSLTKNVIGNSLELAQLMRNSIIFLPLHDQSKEITKKIFKNNVIISSLLFKKISNDQWVNLYNSIDKNNILQSLEYGESQEKLYALKTERYLITDKNKSNIAIYQILEKKFLFFKINRINRGPIFFNDIKNTELIRSVIFSIIQKNKNIFSFLSFSPELLFDYNNIFFKNNKNNFYFNFPSWESSILDLTQEIYEIERSLRPNWRNQLKNSAKNNIVIEIDNSEQSLNNVIYLNNLNSQKKNYKTINKKFLKYFLLKSQKLILKAFQKDNLVATICIVMHGSTSTYLLGWSNEDGRKINAMNSLLWRGIEILKSNGLKNLDLGGYDRDSSEGIFAFKSGIGGLNYKLVGKYNSWSNFFF